ncbi:DUF4446 family protein [Bailinhaonella thermotolerans]|uniref:DUF4446 family protein n=1 Tax=Bailinhaonella thermotolerans TaxID=1070861 RepID=UPI001F5B4EEE|nr:DUF4446 family protein [Bailinhaonella thermotolerans]
MAGLAGLFAGLLAYNKARRVVADALAMLARHSAAEGTVDPRAIRDVAVSRYDALAEMTGRLSFSVAMLNGMGDGIVLTSINGRSETRTYVRPIVGGEGVQPLSPEEEHVVRAARLGQGPDVGAANA